jgi:hypothetical protein
VPNSRPTGIYVFRYSQRSMRRPAAGCWNPTIDVPNLVTLTGTEVLTNKTLTAPTINTPALVNGTSSGMAITTATITQPTLTLKQSATPTPTAEGVTEWDTDDNVLVIGDGAASQIFLPIPASTAAGDIEYYTAAKVKARLAKGTARQALSMNAGATAPAWATLPFSQSFESAQQTITTAGSLTLAHSLSARPKLYSGFLQCTTAEFGYSIGDEVIALTTTGLSASDRGVSIVPDATNMNIRYGNDASVFSATNKTTGVYQSLTNANWRFVVRAWA